MADVTLPEDVAPVRLPAAIETKAEGFAYLTRWSSEGHRLQIKTEITSEVSTRVCGPEQIEAIRAAFRSIEPRLRPILRFSRSGTPRNDALPLGDEDAGKDDAALAPATANDGK